MRRILNYCNSTMQEHVSLHHISCTNMYPQSCHVIIFANMAQLGHEFLCVCVFKKRKKKNYDFFGLVQRLLQKKAQTPPTLVLIL